MTINRAVRILAGAMVLLSLGLAYLHSVNWLLLTAFVGLNLIQSGITQFCPAETIFKKMGLKEGC